MAHVTARGFFFFFLVLRPGPPFLFFLVTEYYAFFFHVLFQSSALPFHSACSNVPMNITEVGLKFEISETFAISTAESCTKLKISTIPLLPFRQEVSKTFSSLAIISETQQTRTKNMFVYNEQNPSMFFLHVVFFC